MHGGVIDITLAKYAEERHNGVRFAIACMIAFDELSARTRSSAA